MYVRKGGGRRGEEGYENLVQVNTAADIAALSLTADIRILLFFLFCPSSQIGVNSVEEQLDADCGHLTLTVEEDEKN